MEPPRRERFADARAELDTPGHAQRVKAEMMQELQRRGGRLQEPMARPPGMETGEIPFRPPQHIQELPSPEAILEQLLQGEDEPFRADAERVVSILRQEGWALGRPDIEGILDALDGGQSVAQTVRLFHMQLDTLSAFGPFEAQLRRAT